MEERTRDALAHHPAGVVVVSAADESGYCGLTATTFISVSLAPPLVLVAIDALSATGQAMQASRRFAVSLLSSRQEFLAERFSGRAPVVDPGWREVPHYLGPLGAPLIRDAAGWFECELVEVRAAGDHDLALGRVSRGERGSGEPLVYWDRAFWRLAAL